MITIPIERIRQIEARRDELAASMARSDLAPDQFVKLSKDYAELEPVAQAAHEVRRLRQERDALSFMVEEEGDPELKAMAADELAGAAAQRCGRPALRHP